MSEVRSFEHCGWSFSSLSTSIGNKQDYHALEEELHVGNIPLPEMTYPKNYLEIHHAASGFTLRFDAMSALRSWHQQQKKTHGLMYHPPPPVTSSSSQLSSSPSEGMVDVTRYDWTYKNNYTGDITILPSSTATATLTPTTKTLPLDKLTNRGAIYYYATIPLYASDLADRGICECGVKVRVMEDSFLILLRSYVRLDRDAVWLQDVRWCCGEMSGSSSSGVVGGDEGVVGESLPVVLQDVQTRVANMSSLVKDINRRAEEDAEGGEEVVSTSPAPSLLVLPMVLPSFLEQRQQQQQQQQHQSVAPVTASDSSLPSTPILVSAAANESPPSSSSSSSSSPQIVSATRISSSTSPSSLPSSSSASSSPTRGTAIHPIVLESMRAKAAKQGYQIADDGTPLLAGTTPTTTAILIPPVSTANNISSEYAARFVSVADGSSMSTDNDAAAAPHSMSTYFTPASSTSFSSSSSSSVSSAPVVPSLLPPSSSSSSLPSYFAQTTDNNSSTLLHPHLDISADEVYTAVVPMKHTCSEVVLG